MVSFQKHPLSRWVSLLSLSALGADALAQQQEQQAPIQIEEVHILAQPIRDAQIASIDAKRESLNNVEIIASDAIGRFPDQNLADSLGRIPGLAIERDQGQARYINFRGAPFRYTAIALDGIDVPGAENGRIPRFDSFPSVITSRIEANKAILPSMPGESVAGFININTFNPFDKAGFGLSADIGTGEQELGGGDISKYGLRGSWSNEHFGIVAYGSENSREQITDNREFDLDVNPDNGELIVNELDFRNYKVKREDKAYGGRLEYSGDDVIKRVYLSTLYSEFVDHEERNQFVFALIEPNEGTVGTMLPMAVTRALEYGKYQNSTQTHTLGAEFAAGAWDFSASASLTDTEFGMDLPIPQSMGAGTAGSYDLSNLEDPTLILAQPLDTLSYAFTLGIHYVQQLDIENQKFKFDAGRDFTWFGQDAKLDLGLQYDTKEANGYVASPLLNYAFPVSDIDSYNTGELWDTDMDNSIGGTYYDNKGLYQAWKDTGTLNDDVSDDALIALNEDILAVYAMATTDFDWGNIVFGARVETTDYTSEGTVEGEPISVDDTFTNVLPALHVNWNLTEALKWRNSISTGINRPTYSEWRAAADVNVVDKEVRGGNPTLKAEESIGFDSALEWYFSPASLLSAGVFYRTVDNVIYADSSTIDGGVYVASAAGEEWEYTGAVNGEDGTFNGVELNFIGNAEGLLPGFLSGFGISANATILDSEFTDLNGETHPLPGTSDLVYNASLIYEKYGISTRLNYQYRDEWVSPIESPDEMWDPQTRVDFNIAYEIPLFNDEAVMSLYANANNLTDEIDVRRAGNGTINQVEGYGRHFLVGVRFNY